MDGCLHKFTVIHKLILLFLNKFWCIQRFLLTEYNTSILMFIWLVRKLSEYRRYFNAWIFRSDMIIFMEISNSNSQKYLPIEAMQL